MLVCALASLKTPAAARSWPTTESSALRTMAAESAGYGGCCEYQAKLVRLLHDATLDTRVRAAQSLIALSLTAGRR